MTASVVFMAAAFTAAACYGLYRYALTLHSVPGSWMLGGSLLLAAAVIFELGFGAGILWRH